MIKRIVKILEENVMSTYLIVKHQEESVELFFVKKMLDMNRSKEVEKYSVTVYRDFEQDGKSMRGSSVAHIYKSMTDEEIKETLCDAYYAAAFVRNPYYSLPQGTEEKMVKMPSTLSNYSLEESAKRLTEALFENDTDTTCFLNSAEIFIHKNVKHIVNSEGVDVSYEKHYVRGEFVAQCLEPQDVETYKSFYYDDLETKALSQMVKETLEVTKARAMAKVPPKKGEYKIILAAEYVKTLMSYYLERAGSHMIYPKYSNFQVGDRVQGKEIVGDKLNIMVKAEAPYNLEGIKMMNRSFIKDGVLEMIHGNSRFAHYLGIEATGYYQSIVLPQGTISLEEMKEGEYLHVVNFSDFQMDPFTGHFGGEIRLGFYSNGQEVIPVTGGSISGSIQEIEKELLFAKEIQIEEGYEGPAAVCLKGVTIAGC